MSEFYKENSPERKMKMSNQNRKYQETELQYAALTATLNLIVFGLTAVAVVGLFSLAARIGDLVGTLTYKMPLLILLLIFSGGWSAMAQTGADEEAIRELIRQEAAGRMAVKYAENAVYASDALPRPVFLKNVRDTETVQTQTVSAPRRNQILKIKVRRIVVAESKDIAYEYSDFSLVYDQPDTTRDGYTGSLLRVWHKTNGGEWRVDAAFARQNTRDDDNDDKQDFQKNNAPVGSTVKQPFYMTRLP